MVVRPGYPRDRKNRENPKALAPAADAGRPRHASFGADIGESRWKDCKGKLDPIGARQLADRKNPRQAIRFEDERMSTCMQPNTDIDRPMAFPGNNADESMWPALWSEGVDSKCPRYKVNMGRSEQK